MRYYNSSLGYIQLLSVLPLQKGMYELYKDLGEDKTSTYVTLGLMNIGSVLTSFFVARTLYDVIYDSSKPSKNTEYISSFYSEFLYDHNKRQLPKIKPSKRKVLKDRMDRSLKNARKYESSLVKYSALLYGVSSTFGATVAYRKLNYNLPKSIAYGFFMPSSVIYKDFFDRGLDSK